MSLFSGIGGFELAAEWAGWQNVMSCEINTFGHKVLSHYWPEAYHHNDVHTLTYELINAELTKRFGAEWRSNDVILTGGFPCQPYSVAGKRLGKNDTRHLWPEMLRIISEVNPTWVVGEYVSGLVSWNGGVVFDEVQSDLEAIVYEVLPFILPAASVNAPHKRERIWFVANANDARLERREEQRSTASSGPNQHKHSSRFLRSTWEDFPIESAVCSRNDGFPKRLDSITFPKWRNESIKAAGNAIVPQVAYQIFKAINEYRSI
jgi:DNA (cytosine-5)-methyltransferase 1